jgi:hypothetical protein
MLSLLSLRRYKEVWVFIKDSNGSRPSSARTAKLVELFFTPSVLLQKPRWTFSIAVLSIKFNSSISELLFNKNQSLYRRQSYMWKMEAKKSI